jgi:hypothetical protein
MALVQWASRDDSPKSVVAGLDGISLGGMMSERSCLRFSPSGLEALTWRHWIQTSSFW